MSLKKWYSTRNPKVTREDDDEIEKIFKLLKEGEEKIELDENHKNPLFVLGNTGSGKSTLILFVSTDNSSLRSEETFPGSDEYIIVDEDKIGSGITSQTLFPELFIDDKVPAAYYDCPGFNDTRSPSKEIAASYFIKKVFDFADELKLILTVAYPSVRIGVERSDFMGLMKHSATLIKEIDKYQSSIALLVTKVDNDYKKVNGQIVLKPDEEMIDRIAQFMISVKEEIKLMVPGNEEEAEFHKRTIKFIDTLLRKDGGKYSRIGIFRRPDEAGPLCGVSLLQERKPAMKELLYKTLKFTKKNSADFGYTISDRSKLHVNDMVDRIKVNVSAEIENVVSQLKTYDESVANQVLEIIKSMARDSNAEVDQVTASGLASKLTASFDAITKLKADVVKAKTIKQIAEAIKVCGTKMQINTETSVSNLIQQDNYFDFLQNVNGGLNIGDYSKSFDVIIVTITAARKEIEKDSENTANSVKDRIKVNVNKVPSELESCYDDKFESLGIKELTTALAVQHKIVEEFVGKIKKVKSAQALSREITNMVSKSEINSTEVNAASLEIFNYGNYLTVLNIFKKEVVVWSPDWIKPFEGHADYVFKTQKWYNFLQKLYVKLSAYTYFQYRERYDVANIDDWGKDGKPQGIKITKANYTKFLEKINETDETIKKMDLDDKKSKELNRVLELTIKQKISSSFDSDNGELSIEAVFVKFSDFVDSAGKLNPDLSNGKKVKSLSVRATDTIFVDRTMNVNGDTFDVNIVAPNWEITDKKSIDLSGAVGQSQGQASNATNSSGNGSHGNVGLPGGPGGNFVGVGYAFKGAGNLTVISNGGRGGIGQKGGNGANGANGADADNTDDFSHEIYSSTSHQGMVSSSYRFFGQDGGVGGNGGNGGVGGIGGLPGKIKIIRNDGVTSLPATKTDKGSTGVGNEGGTGGEGGKKGNNLRIKKEGSMGSFHWVNSSRKVEVTSIYSANGSGGTRNSSDVGKIEPESADPIHVGEALNNFEFYMRELVHDRFLKETLKRFLDSLQHNKNLYKDHVYDTSTLANNLSNLEAQIYQLNNTLTNDEIIYLYQSIIDRTTEYINNPQPDEDTKEYKKALKYIQTAALCQIQFRKSSFAPNLIIDVTRYLDNVLRDVKILKDLNDKNNKLKVVNEAKEKFKSTIDKKIAEALSFIQNEILSEIDNIFEELHEQIDKLIEEVIKLQNAAEKEVERLKEKKNALVVALGLSIILSAAKIGFEFMGPVGKVGKVGVGIIEKTVPSTRAIKASDVESIKLEIKEIKKDTAKAKANKPNPVLLGDVKNRYQGKEEKLSTIDDAIKEAEENLLALQEYEKYIYDTMMPMIDDMEKHLDEISAQLGSQSQVALDITRWKVQSTLTDVKSQMRQMTRGFSVEDDIARCIEKLEEAMTTQINIYDRIQSYQDQQVLADYIAVVSTGINESNPELSATLRTLEVMIRSNLVLDQHKQAVNAVTQNVFPFAHLYLNSSYLAFSVRSEEGLAEVVAEAVKQLNAMKANIEKYKTSIGKQDEYITNSQFNSEFVSTKPFYVWTNAKHKGFISKLLAGKKVILYTDVRRANTDKFAIKFNLSEINFKAPNKEIQAEINEKLKKFKANMKHLGSSYYRFREGVYVIYSESQTVQYTFEKTKNDEPVQFNGVYEKIKNGDLMLSPFAMWEMQLTNVVSDGDFKDLEKFKDKVDLELVGRGNYVNQDLEVGVLHVDDYYKSDPAMLANDKW